MLKDTLVSPFLVLALVFLLASTTFLSVQAHSYTVGRLVLKHQRKLLTRTEHGEISAASITDGAKAHLQFITLEPNAVFLPVVLHADMVFFVHTGSGTLSWTDDDDDDDVKNVNIRKGDIYRLQQGSVFYVQSSLEAGRERLRIYAIFTNTEDDIYEPSVGAYSSITDMVLGFDSRLLRAAFKVPDDVIEEMLGASKAPAIIHAVDNLRMFGELQARVLKAFQGSNRGGFFGSINGRNKKKMKAYNVLEADPDFENCNGWSVTVDKKDLHFLKHSNIGIFMVNLTKGSMMAPHWNPRAAEIAIVLQGQGMVQVLCSSHAKKSECRNMRYRVEEGDVFAVPRFHPMAQISFNNDSFVFMGFSTSTEKNNPQFLAGKRSALRSLDRDILAWSFNVSKATIDHLLQPQKESVILDCTSCAEEEERLMEEEIERERREEEEEARKKKEEEEDRKRREEEAKKREEEEARRKREEEAKKREEEEARRKREEEAKKREEEEARRKREEEEEAKKEQEEAKRQEEERQRKAREKEEAQRRREEEEAEKRRKEKEEEIRRKEEARRKKEQEEMRKEEEEEKKRREEEAKKEQERARRQEEERQRKAKEEEKEAQRRKEQEEAQRRKDEEAMREQEEARRREKERQRKKREEEETQRRKEEEEEEAQRMREEQEEAQRREEERKERSKEARREQEEARRQEEERKERSKEARREQEEARRQEEERQRRAKEEKEWRRHEKKRV
ncbi:hypothetical protein GQ457_06G040230 [Hibiscus cannabinus]